MYRLGQTALARVTGEAIQRGDETPSAEVPSGVYTVCLMMFIVVVKEAAILWLSLIGLQRHVAVAPFHCSTVIHTYKPALALLKQLSSIACETRSVHQEYVSFDVHFWQSYRLQFFASLCL